MNIKLFFTLLLFACGCATTPMPIPTVPRHKNAAIGSASFSNNGVNLNLGYVTRKRVVLDLSLQTQFLLARSYVYDLGLGGISYGHKFLGMLTFGYGRHDVYPVTMGLTHSVYRTSVDAFRVSSYLNFGLADDIFLGIRCSGYWGDGEHYRIGDQYNNHRKRETFQGFGFEPAVFTAIGKSDRVLLGVGIHLIGEEKSGDEKLFKPWPLWFSISYQFEKNFKIFPSPTQPLCPRLRVAFRTQTNKHAYFPPEAKRGFRRIRFG